jgi:hypothetical protein
MSEIVLRHGVGHGDDGTLGHGISEAVGKRGGTGDGSHVEDDTAPIGFQKIDRREHAVVHTFHIDTEEAVEIGFGGGFQFADVRNACVIDEDVERAKLCKLLKDLLGLGLIGNIAGMGRGLAAGFGDFLCRAVGRNFVKVDCAESSPGGGKS